MSRLPGLIGCIMSGAGLGGGSGLSGTECREISRYWAEARRERE